MFSIRIINQNYYASDKRDDEFGVGLNNNFKPIKTGNFLTSNNLNGRVLNDILSGSWLEWQTKFPVFIDGRLEVMKENLATEYGESLRDRKAFYSLLKKFDIELLVFNYSIASNWLTYVSQDSSYRLVHFDDVSCVYLKKGYYDNIPTFDFSHLSESTDFPHEIESVPVESILLKKNDGPILKWLKGFFTNARYSEVLKDANIGFFLMRNAQPSLAELYCLRALNNTRYNFENIYLILGAIYLDESKPDKAYFCLNKVLEQNPDNSVAKTLLNKIKKK